VLRKALAESREAFVEQERNFAGLDEPPDEWGFNDLLNQYSNTKAEHEELEKQAPQLREANRDLREVVQQRKQELLAAEAKVHKLSEMQEVEHAKVRELEERLIFLQHSMKENEEKERRVKDSEKNAHSKLRVKLEHIQVVSDDHHALLLRRDIMQAGERSKRRRAKANSPNGGSSPSRRPGARTSLASRNFILDSLTSGDTSPSQLPAVAEAATPLPALTEVKEAAPAAADSAASAGATPTPAQQTGGAPAEPGPPEAQQLGEAEKPKSSEAEDGLGSMPLAGRAGDSPLRRKADRKTSGRHGTLRGNSSKARGTTP